VVADATNLNRTLCLALELKLLKKPTVVALNMMDLASKRGLVIDLEVLSRELDMVVIPTIAVKRSWIKELQTRIDDLLASIKPGTNSQSSQLKRANTLSREETFAKVDEIVSRATRKALTPDYVSSKIDTVVLHPVWGSMILAATMFLIFQAVFTWAWPPQDWIESGIAALSGW